ncbi:MAG: Glyoxalase family protein, partial [uncultured Solirubrobacteraceae bacterium]
GHPVPPDLRQPPRRRPRRVQGVLRGARLHVRREVHGRDLRLHGRQRAGLRHAARPRALRRLHGEAGGRRPHLHRGDPLRLGREPRRGRRPRRRRPGRRRLPRQRPDGPRLHVRPLVQRPGRPPLGGHVDEPGGRRGRPAGHGADRL